MQAEEQAGRQQVVREALSWVGTPYHHQGSIKGVGVDCAFLLIKVYEACGLVPPLDPRPYPRDWHLHRAAERYLAWVQQYARPVAAPQPGDLALFRYGRCVSHGAIVIAWPLIVHALAQAAIVTREDASLEPLAGRLAGFYSYWGGG